VTFAEAKASGPLITFQDIARLARSDTKTSVIARPRWSTDDRWLAFVSYAGLPPGRDHKLWTVEAKVASSPELLYESDGVIAAHTWSPDGSCLAVADSEAGVVSVRIDGTSEILDAEAMRYPLMENAMTWLDDGRHLLYMSLVPKKAGLWILEMSSRQKRQVVALSEDEIMIPAGVSEKDQVDWGALRGNMRQHERGTVLHFWPSNGGKLEAVALPDAEFDLASNLLPNHDGSWWAFTVWREGKRVPFVVDLLARQGHILDTPGVVSDLLRWSDAPAKLWVLLHPPRLVGLDVDESTRATLFEQSFYIELTSPELVYLLETLGAQSMLGLIDPFADLAPGEASEVREKAETSLISKNYVTILSGDKVQIDLTVAALVQCCVSPQQTWTVTFKSATGERDVRHFHRTQDLLVEDTVLDSGLHRLTPLRDKATGLKRVKRQVHLDKQTAANGQSFTLPEEALFRIRDIATAIGEETAAQYLIGAGVAEDTASRFAQALARPLSNSSISCWAAVGGEIREDVEEGLGILEGASGLWLLKSCTVAGEAYIKILPADTETILRQVAELFTWGME